jgi:Mg2+ and Co2+ transporter CorA
MYKSVTIGDSKQSPELASGLWRLSWITSIFLPLTFLAGLFGMNVASCKHNPSIKWYLVAAMPLVSYSACGGLLIARGAELSWGATVPPKKQDERKR